MSEVVEWKSAMNGTKCINAWSTSKKIKDVLDFYLKPHPGAWTQVSEAFEWKSARNGTKCPNMNTF